MESLKQYTSDLDYYSNIYDLPTVIENSLKNITSIAPILNNDDTKYSNLEYSNLVLGINSDLEDKLYFDKVKLKYNIIKNISDNQKNKTRSYALWYYDKITQPDNDDKITYYIDYYKDYDILNNIVDSTDVNETKLKLKQFLIKLKNGLFDKDLQKALINGAEDIYLGPKIFLNFYFIDIIVLCGVFILAVFLFSLKPVIDIYKSGLLLLALVIVIVCITMFFYNFKK